MTRKLALAVPVALAAFAAPQLADAHRAHGFGAHGLHGFGAFHRGPGFGFRPGYFAYYGGCWRWTDWPYPHRLFTC